MKKRFELKEGQEQKPTVCPVCSKRHDMASNVAEAGAPAARPQPGSFSLCISCGAINVFQEDMTLRPATDSENFNVLTCESGAEVSRLIDFIHANPCP